MNHFYAVLGFPGLWLTCRGPAVSTRLDSRSLAIHSAGGVAAVE
jgi:hypothetical protein